MACVRKQRGGPCHRLYTSRTQTSNSRLAMSPPILYLVTTKSSAMVCSCCSSSDIVAPASEASLWLYDERTAEITHATTRRLADRPAPPTASTHSVATPTTQPRHMCRHVRWRQNQPNRGFWMSSKKGHSSFTSNK